MYIVIKVRQEESIIAWLFFEDSALTQVDWFPWPFCAVPGYEPGFEKWASKWWQHLVICAPNNMKIIIAYHKFFHRFEYLFNFDNTFEIHDDIEVLKRMGMAFGLEKGQCGEANLRASRTMVPKALEPYVMGEFVRYLCKLCVKVYFLTGSWLTSAV